MNKRKKILMLFILTLVFIKVENVYAYEKYTLKDYAYFDPVSTRTCDDTNYWTIYNQDTTCYRFIVLETEDTASKSTIKLMLDHDLSTSNFDGYQNVLNSARSTWTRYNGTIDIPNEEDIAKVMKLDTRPELVDGVSTSLYNGVRVYTLNTNSMYTINKVKTNHAGYWLSGTYSNNDYAYTISEYGNNRLTEKVKVRGVRPSIVIDKSLLTKSKAYTDISNIVTNSTEYKYPFLSTQYGGYTYKQMQGFTVSNSKLIFHSSHSSNPDYGILFSYGGNSYQTLNKAEYSTTGHGNGLTYNSKTNKVLLVGANEYNDLYEYDGDTLERTNVYTSADGYAGAYSTIGYDKYNDYYVVQASRKIIILNTNFEELYSFDVPHFITGQDLEYHNGYIYYATFDAGQQTTYQIYTFDEAYSSIIHVYNAKFKKDGTPEKDFGRLVDTLYVRNINKDNLGGIGEIEGISFKGNNIWLGYAAQHFDTTNTYKFYTFNDSSVQPKITVSKEKEETDYNTIVTFTSDVELKELSGWTLSNDKYSISKAYDDSTSSDTTIEICDNYTNCVSKTVERLSVKKPNLSFSENAVNKSFSDGTYTLAATQSGNGTIAYSSSDETIATVNQSGKVTFIKTGTVIITATVNKNSEYYKDTASYALNITKGNQELSFDVTSISKNYTDQDFTVNLNHTKGNGTISYSSSNEGVATVDQNGKVTIRGVGTTTITATVSETSTYNSASTSYSLNVVANGQTIRFENSSVTKQYTDRQFTIKVTRVEGDGDITYSSSNNDIATVNNEGTVTIISAGRVTITATASQTAGYDETSASYSLNIEKSNQQFTEVEETIEKEAEVGESFRLEVGVNLGDGNITYSSSNEEVATISQDGLVTITGVGTTTLTVTAEETANFNRTVTSTELTVREKQNEVEPPVPSTDDPTPQTPPPSEQEIEVPNTGKTISILLTLFSISLIVLGIIYIYRKKPIFLQTKEK